MKLLLALCTLALAVPATALAGPTLTMREVPLHATRALAAGTPRFDLLGLHWRGPGVVRFRTRDISGRWSAWRTADDDGNLSGGWHLGNPVWTGSATAAAFETRGHVLRLRAYYIWSPLERLAARRLQIANAPPIIPRASWGADESIRRAPPQYTDTIHFAVVHHTAGTNSYTEAQSAAIVRGIEIYHVEGNGWNDIGYNFLIDKYGQVFEGRYGGVDKAVVGAHSLGFNTGSVGIAIIGNYQSTQISAAARTSLEQLLAWKLDLAHVDPLSTLTWPSGGNPRFPAGLPVPLRAISGHRDTGFTDCPGNALYAELPGIARDVAALGGPKIYAPLATKNGEGQVAFAARLSVAQPWTVTIVNSAGQQVAQGSGSGTAIAWTWDASQAPPDRYTWTIASPNARSATGTLGAVTALALQQAAAVPNVVAPAEATTIAYTLTAPATVTATLAGPLGTVATLFSAPKGAGAQTLAVTVPPGLTNGAYTVQLTATAGTRTVATSLPLTVDDIVTGFTATAAAVTFTLARPPASIALQVLRGTTAVAQLPVAQTPGPQSITWAAPNVPDGVYTLALTVTDEVGTWTRTTTVTLDRTPPRITVLSGKNMRFRVSEPATLTLIAGGRRYTRVLKKATTTQFWLRSKPVAYTLSATDAAGNTSTFDYRR